MAMCGGKKKALYATITLGLLYTVLAQTSFHETLPIEHLLGQVKNLSWTSIVWIVLLLVSGSFLFDALFSPTFAPAHLHPVPEKCAQAVNRSKQAGMPPCYPNGWYKIFDSFELNKGVIKPVDILGSHLIAFRGQDGKVAVLDGYCPHLGADLAGGRVRDNCVECPFHGWQFGKDGQCTTIPYSDKIPDIAKVASWPVREVNQMIFVYFHTDRNPEPIYPCPIYPEVDSGAYIYHGKTSHYVAAHIQELPENGADTAHLDFLHIPFVLQWLSPTIEHRWEATWTPGEGEESHVAKIYLSQYLQFCRKDIPGTKVKTTISQIGPGVVFLTFHFFFGKMVIIGTVTPLAPLLQIYDHVVFAEKHIPRVFAKIVLWSLAAQLDRDVPIWNSKTFLSKPMIVKNDGKIAQFRRWFSQFYTKNEDGSLKKAEGLDW